MMAEENVSTVAGQLPAEFAGGELRMLPLSEIYESPLNPRKYFAEGPLAELAESIRKGGIRTPLIARSRLVGGGYELAAGHRRLRAARRAGVEFAPVIVREMSDADFLEVLTFENAQREDVHPLEEAEGFRVYMDQALAEVPDVAAKVGKSQSYVYQRLKLLELTDESKRAFWDGEISAGQAILIARLDAKGQSKALRACEPPSWDPQKVVSVRDLQAWIKKNLHLDLNDARFPKDAADLIPDAGSCVACPHRLGNQPDFNPVEDMADICTRPACYEQKALGFVEVEKVRLRAIYPNLVLVSDERGAVDGIVQFGDWRESAAGQPALQIDGPDAGRELRVVVQQRLPAPPPAPTAPQQSAKPKPSKEEKEREAQRREQERKARDEEEARQKREREEREAKLEKEKGVRKAILKAILDKTAWPPKREEFLGLLHNMLDNNDLPEVMDDVIAANGLSTAGNYIHTDDLGKCSDNQLARLTVLAAVYEDFEDYAFGHGCDKLYEAAKRYGVDHRKIRAEAEGGTRKAVVANLPALNAPEIQPSEPRLGVPCPQCHAAVGERCTNYKGQYCHPHGARKLPALNAPAKKAAAKKSAPVAKKAPAKKAPAKKGGKK